MNYAQDRLDRHELIHSVLQQQQQQDEASQQQLIHHDTDQTIPTRTSENNGITTTTTTSTAAVVDHHTKYGQYCMTVGWNHYHALYHYCRAWYDEPTNCTKLGNYIQMLEFCSAPELALLLLFVYRTLGVVTVPTTSDDEDEDDNSIKKCNNDNNFVQSLLIPPPTVADDYHDNAIITTPSSIRSSSSSSPKGPTRCNNNNNQQHRYKSNHSSVTSMEDMIGYHCGCQDSLCGRIDCGGSGSSGYYSAARTVVSNCDEQAITTTSTDAVVTNRRRLHQRIHYHWIPVSDSSIQYVISQLQIYCQQSIVGIQYPMQLQPQPELYMNVDHTIMNDDHTNIKNKDTSTNTSTSSMTFSSSTVMEQEQRGPKITAHEILGKYTSDSKTCKKMISYINESNHRIPRIFQFWKSNKSDVNSYTTSSDAKPIRNDSIQEYRPFIPVVQLLCMKLLYLVIPSLAIEAMVHMQFHCETRIAKKNCGMYAMNDPDDEWDALSMMKEYKSHYAFYIFIQSLVFGERIKPSRRKQMIYHHISLWDRLWGFNGIETTHNRLCQTDISPTAVLPTDDIYNYQKIAEQFIEKLRQLTHRLYDHSNYENACSIPRPIWLQPFVTGTSSSITKSQQDGVSPIFLIGDSHVLSLAWQQLTIQSSIYTKSFVVVPILITGLKAWHIKFETRFFTNTNLMTMIQRIPTETQTVIISAGEIDCREGMGGPLLQGYTQECYDHVKATVHTYVSALAKIIELPSNSISQILVLPVAPHIERNKGRVVGHASRRETMQVWNDEIRRQLEQYSGTIYLLDYIDKIQIPIRDSKTNRHDTSYALNPIFNADSTHLNSAFLSIFRDAIVQSGCDLNKL